MTYAPKTGSFRKTLALAVVVVGVAAPVAAARTGDALDRYLTTHHAVSTTAPVSDVASSLQVARIGAAQPNDALDRYLSLNRAPSSPAPISDNANSQMLVRSASAAPIVSVSGPPGFAWTDAGIGAGMTLLVLLAFAAGLTLVRRHRELTV
jgi:hypothetical protein